MSSPSSDNSSSSSSDAENPTPAGSSSSETTGNYGITSSSSSYPVEEYGSSSSGSPPEPSSSSSVIDQPSSSSEYPSSSSSTQAQSSSSSVVNPPTNLTVTVATGSNSFGTGSKYHLDGSVSPTIMMRTGVTYTLDVSHASNSGLPFRFSTTPDGTNAGGTEYTAGVSRTGRPGSAGAKVTIIAPGTAATLNYYSPNLAGMGSSVDVQ